MLWQTITKAFTLMTSDIDVEVGDDIAGTYNFV